MFVNVIKYQAEARMSKDASGVGPVASATVFQMAEVAVPRDLFRRILEMISDLRCRQAVRCYAGR
jgi:hypothetical protein